MSLQGKYNCRPSANALLGKAEGVMLLQLPNMPEHGDVSDWISAGGTEEQLLELIEQTKEYEYENDYSKFLLGEDWLKSKLPVRKVFMYPYLTEKTITEVDGDKSVGKTFFGLATFICLTHKDIDGNLLTLGQNKVINTCPCLYVDGEMPEQEMQERMNALRHDLTPVEPFKLLSIPNIIGRELIPPNFTVSEDREALLQFLIQEEQYKVIFFDNVSCLFENGTSDENSIKDWKQYQDWLGRIRARGFSVVFFHHTGYSAEHGRGTSGRQDIIDNQIVLKRKKSSVGVRFGVEYLRARSFGSKDRETWELEFDIKDNQITWQESEGKVFADIIRRLMDGATQKQVQEEFSCGQSYVSQCKQKAIKEGYIRKDSNSKLKLTDKFKEKY